MKRVLTVFVVLLGLSLLPIGPNARTKAQQGGKIAVKCPPLKTLNKEGIAGCPDSGCGGSLDPLLNTQKNVTEGDPDNAEHKPRGLDICPCCRNFSVLLWYASM